MKNYDEKSYKKYKQYRLNKYRYEQEQIYFPLAVILTGTVLISIRHYILLAIMIVAIAILTCFLLKKHLAKQMRAVQTLVISSEEAQDGGTRI